MGPEAEPQWSLADVLLYLVMAVPFFLAGFLAALGMMTAAGVDIRGVRVLASQFAGFALALVPLWLLFERKYGQSPVRLLRMGVSARDGVAAIPAGIVTAFGVLALAVLLRTPQFETPMEKLLGDPLSLAAAAILGVTLAPWFEELMFRGLLQPVMVRWTGILPGIVLSALPFALLHGPQYAWSWRHVLLITCAGAAFGWRRHRTGSTGAAAVMHSAYNAVLFAGYVAAKWSGTDLPRPV